MTLTESERQSALWIKLREELTTRLDRARRKNDGAMNDIETSNLRGEIRCLKQILAFGDPPSPVQVVENHDF